MNGHDSYDAETLSCATPIYDALYSEHRRLFRAVPGDRSGEQGPRPGVAPVPYPRPGEARPVVPIQYAGHLPNGQGWGATKADRPATPRTG